MAQKEIDVGGTQSVADDGVIYWQKEWFKWRDGAYRAVPDGDVKALLCRSIKVEFDRVNVETIAALKAQLPPGQPIATKELPTALKVTTKLVNDTMQALTGMCLLPAAAEPPLWLGGTGPFPATETLAASNGSVHLPSLVEGKPCFLSPTRKFFTLNALDYAFDPEAPKPVEWLDFLDRLWPNDPESIRTLQQWFGLCLLPETRQQKMLMLIGPTRSGKGTIARILADVIGAANVAGPPLSSLGTDFGLAPLLGKTLAIVPDGRLSGRTDSAMIAERLLAITGEDTLTINRKHLPPVTTRLKARLLLLSNELPRFSDSSRALANRMIVLRLTRSWLGKEDRALGDRLAAELPGILLWAIAGWKQLRDEGHLTQPQAGRELLEELEDLSSPISAFVRDCCVVDAARQVSIKELFDRWKAWCQAKGEAQVGKEQLFCRNLRAAEPGLVLTRPRVNGEQLRCYQGIRLRSERESGLAP
jgi:putative DNA primase/helicase